MNVFQPALLTPSASARLVPVSTSAWHGVTGEQAAALLWLSQAWDLAHEHFEDRPTLVETAHWGEKLWDVGCACPHLSHVAVVVKRAQVVEQLQRAHQRLGRRGVHEVEVHLAGGSSRTTATLNTTVPQQTQEHLPATATACKTCVSLHIPKT